MDKWVKIVKPVTSHAESINNLKSVKQDRPSNSRYHPYSKQHHKSKSDSASHVGYEDSIFAALTWNRAPTRTYAPSEPQPKLSTKDLNKILLSTLSNPANPITNNITSQRFGQTLSEN